MQTAIALGDEQTLMEATIGGAAASGLHELDKQKFGDKKSQASFAMKAFSTLGPAVCLKLVKALEPRQKSGNDEAEIKE